VGIAAIAIDQSKVLFMAYTIGSNKILSLLKGQFTIYKKGRRTFVQ